MRDRCRVVIDGKSKAVCYGNDSLATKIVTTVVVCDYRISVILLFTQFYCMSVQKYRKPILLQQKMWRTNERTKEHTLLGPWHKLEMHYRRFAWKDHLCSTTTMAAVMLLRQMNGKPTNELGQAKHCVTISKSRQTLCIWLFRPPILKERRPILIALSVVYLPRSVLWPNGAR